MPSYGESRTGNLYVHYTVVFPNVVSPALRSGKLTRLTSGHDQPFSAEADNPRVLPALSRSRGGFPEDAGRKEEGRTIEIQSIEMRLQGRLETVTSDMDIAQREFWEASGVQVVGQREVLLAVQLDLRA